MPSDAPSPISRAVVHRSRMLLRDRCKATLSVNIVPYFSDSASSPGSHSDDLHPPVKKRIRENVIIADSASPPAVVSDPEQPPSKSDSEASEDDCICVVIRSECNEWANVKPNPGDTSDMCPCYCKMPWARQRAAVPRRVLEAAYELSNLQLIVPNIYVAFQHDHYRGLDAGTACHTGIIRNEFEFTHHVNVVIGEDLPPNRRFPRFGLSRESFCGTCFVKRFQVAVPPTAGRLQTKSRLSLSQLAFARDFISLGLNYPECAGGPHGSGARVLITTSENCPADAMAIVVCYLSYATGYPAQKLAKYFNSEPSIRHAWNDALANAETMQTIQAGAAIAL